MLFIAGYWLTHALIHFAYKKQLLDIANHRSSHIHAKPRIGGLSFVCCISLCFMVFGYCLSKPGLTSPILYTIAPALIVALIGLADDLTDLRQSIRFILYFLSSTLALSNLHSIFENDLWIIILAGGVLSLGFTWLINLFNFMDGIDGIAASESIFVLVSLAFFSYSGGDINLSYLIILSSAPIAGFLILNWQPAKIFMGDMGSTFLGCLIGSLCILMINEKLMNGYPPI